MFSLPDDLVCWSVLRWSKLKPTAFDTPSVRDDGPNDTCYRLITACQNTDMQRKQSRRARHMSLQQLNQTEVFKRKRKQPKMQPLRFLRTSEVTASCRTLLQVFSSLKKILSSVFLGSQRSGRIDCSAVQLETSAEKDLIFKEQRMLLLSGFGQTSM